MKVPDLEYLIEEEQKKKEESDASLYAYYDLLEFIKSSGASNIPSSAGLLNRREIHQMEKEERKKRELKKLKRILGL